MAFEAYRVINLIFPFDVECCARESDSKRTSITLRQAIKIIESSSNFKFFFNPSDLDALPGKIWIVKEKSRMCWKKYLPEVVSVM